MTDASTSKPADATPDTTTDDMSAMLESINKNSWAETSDGSESTLSVVKCNDSKEAQALMTKLKMGGIPKGGMSMVGPKRAIKSAKVSESTEPAKALPRVTLISLSEDIKSIQHELKGMLETERMRNMYIVRFIEELKERLDIDQEDPEQERQEHIRRQLKSQRNQDWLIKGDNLERQICKENNAVINGKDYAEDEDTSDSDALEVNDDVPEKPETVPAKPEPAAASDGQAQESKKRKKVQFKGVPVLDPSRAHPLQPSQGQIKRKRTKGYTEVAQQAQHEDAGSSQSQPDGKGTAGMKSKQGENLNVVEANNVNDTNERQRKKLAELEKIVRQRELESKRNAYGGSAYGSYQVRQGGGSGGGGYRQGGYGGGSYGGGGYGGGYPRGGGYSRQSDYGGGGAAYSDYDF